MARGPRLSQSRAPKLQKQEAPVGDVHTCPCAVASQMNETVPLKSCNAVGSSVASVLIFSRKEVIAKYFLPPQGDYEVTFSSPLSGTQIF